MNDRTIEDLLEEYHATKQRQATAKNTLKRPLPTPPLPAVQVKQQLKQKKQPIDKKRRKLSPNVYVSHYFQRGCKSNTHRSDTFECDAIAKEGELNITLLFFPFSELVPW